MADFDVCVVGSGPGGQKAAIQAAKLGKRVAVVERMEQVGGVAIHTGTIPSKALRQAIIQATQGRDHLAVRGDVKAGRISMETLLASCQRIVATEMELVGQQLRRNGVELLTGRASFNGPHDLRVEGARARHEITADKFVLAIGTEPARPPEIPFDGRHVVTSDDLTRLPALPHQLIVVGGGVIGAEFASMFARLGVRVTLVERQARVLSFLDLQIGEALQFHMRQRGMTLRLNEEVSEVRRLEERDDGLHVELTTRSGKRIRGGVLLYCVGRQGVADRLNLAAVGLEADPRGRLAVDENYRTANPDVYAVGDLVGFPALASTAMNQGRAAARHICGRPTGDSPELYPFGIYSVPEISMVGRSEEQLTAAGVPFESGVAHYKELARGQLLADEVGMLKLLFHPETLEVLGVHILGTHATELVHIGQAVMALGGTMRYFVDHAFNYPTLAEAYRVAALNGINKL